MARFFIHRPIFAIVISLIIVIVGIISGLQLPIDQYPQISPPTISVSTTYTGANASVVNNTVAQIIEQKVNGTQGMDYMNSTSDSTGSYSLSVKFDLDTVGDMDAVNVQNNVAIANSGLPSDVVTAGVTTKKSSTNMALLVALVSPNGTYDRAFIDNYLQIYLEDNIKRVHGVGDVQVFGSDYAMRVWLNPDKLANVGLTSSDVVSAIKAQNIQAPAGTIGQLPAPEDQEKQYTGIVEGRLTMPEEFENIILKSVSNGSFVRLRDVARVETGTKNSSVLAEYNGQDAIAFGIMLTEDANAMDTLKEVKKILEES